MRLIVVVVIAALVTPALASKHSAHRWQGIQSLAQTADLIVIGEPTHIIQEKLSVTRPDGVVPDSIEAEITVRVESVVVGDAKLVGTDLVVRKGQVLFRDTDKRRRMWFIRTDDGGVRRVPYTGIDGALPIEGSDIALWLEGKERTDRYTVDELLERVKAYRERRMRLDARARPAAGGVLDFEVELENIGARATEALPPSHVFNCLRVVRLRGGVQHARDDWGSVDHWEFLRKEPTVVVAPGKRHTFRYKIAFEQLGITEPGEYRVFFEYHPRQLSQHADPATVHQAWLGTTKDFVTIIDVKKSHF